MCVCVCVSRFLHIWGGCVCMCPSVSFLPTSVHAAHLDVCVCVCTVCVCINIINIKQASCIYACVFGCATYQASWWPVSSRLLGCCAAHWPQLTLDQLMCLFKWQNGSLSSINGNVLYVPLPLYLIYIFNQIFFPPLHCCHLHLPPKFCLFFSTVLYC